MSGLVIFIRIIYWLLMAASVVAFLDSSNPIALFLLLVVLFTDYSIWAYEKSRQLREGIK